MEGVNVAASSLSSILNLEELAITNAIARRLETLNRCAEGDKEWENRLVSRIKSGAFATEQ